MTSRQGVKSNSVARRQPDRSVASAHTVMIKPMPMNTNVRTSGGRSRSFSSRSGGGFTSAKPGPRTSAAPKANARRGRKLSPRSSTWASSTIPSQDVRDRSRCYLCLVIRPRWTRSGIQGGSHDSLHASRQNFGPGPWLPPSHVPITARHFRSRSGEAATVAPRAPVRDGSSSCA